MAKNSDEKRFDEGPTNDRGYTPGQEKDNESEDES